MRAKKTSSKSLVTEIERKKDRQTDRQTKRECVCVCVCVLIMREKRVFKKLAMGWIRYRDANLVPTSLLADELATTPSGPDYRPRLNSRFVLPRDSALTSVTETAT